MTLIELFEEYSANRSDLTRKCAVNMRQRMQKYVLPALGSRDIEGIRVSEIYRLLQEIREKNETARQLINYIGQCYTFASALEYTTRQNPAPALRQLMRLPAIKDHYPALGYQQLGRPVSGQGRREAAEPEPDRKPADSPHGAVLPAPHRRVCSTEVGLVERGHQNNRDSPGAHEDAPGLQDSGNAPDRRPAGACEGISGEQRD